MHRTLSRFLGRLAVAGTLVLATALVGHAQTATGQAMDDQWHFSLIPYFWAAGIDGAVSVKGLPEVPVHKSFSDVISDFDIGLLGHFEARKNRWGFGFDLMYLNLGAPVAEENPILGPVGIQVEFQQLMTEGLAFYRVARGGREDNPAHVDLVVGTRYFGTSALLEGDVFQTEKQKVHWVDALIGLRFQAPLGSRLSLLGRGDIAGLGSDFTWNVEGDLALSLSKRWALGAGWRHIDINYDKGDDTDRRLFDIAFDGPRTWVSYTW